MTDDEEEEQEEQEIQGEQGEQEEVEEEDLIEVELHRSPDDVAAALRAIADDLEEGNQITIEAADESATVDPPTGDLEYEFELEREPGDEGDEIELEIELEWVVPRGSDADE